MPENNQAERDVAAPPPARWWVKTSLVMGATIMALLVVEGSLHLFGYRPRVQYRTLLGQQIIRDPAPGVRYMYRPHSSFLQRWPSNPSGYFDQATNGLVYRLNNYGFRGGDFTEARTEALRIALLGDSFCWGVGVKDDDHFATRLEGMLNRDRALGAPVEVYNFGISGYNTAHEVALLEHVVLRFSPDVCVMLFFLNDAAEPGQVVGTMDHLGGDDLLKGWRRHCYLLDLVVRPADAYFGKRMMVKEYQKVYRPGSPEIDRIAKEFRRFAEFCKTHGATPIVVIHPVLIDLDESYPFSQAHERVLARAAETGIAAFDLLNDFKGQEGPPLWVHPSDPHPNHKAHGITAEAIRNYLVGMHRQGTLLPHAPATPEAD